MTEDTGHSDGRGWSTVIHPVTASVPRPLPTFPSRPNSHFCILSSLVYVRNHWHKGMEYLCGVGAFLTGVSKDLLSFLTVSDTPALLSWDRKEWRVRDTHHSSLPSDTLTKRLRMASIPTSCITFSVSCLLIFVSPANPERQGRLMHGK